MMRWLLRTYRRMTGKCPGCGYLLGVPIRIEDCPECGSPHEIFGVLRCPTCQARLDDNEILYPDDPEEMESYS